MALWTPALIATDSWWDFSDAETVTIDTGISQIEDKSGNSRHASQSTAASQPMLSVGGFGGMDCAGFDGADDSLVISVPQALPCHIFAIIDTTSLQTSDRILLGRSVSIAPYPPGLNVGQSSANQSPCVYWGIGWPIVYSAGVAGPYLLECRLSSSEAGIAVNAGTEQVGSHSQTVLSTWTSINNSTVQQGAYKLGEVVIINRALSTDDVQKVQGYLAWKWGMQANLPSDHPYKSSAPVAAAASRVLATLEQLWGDNSNIVRVGLEQPWGIKLGVDLLQAWTDAPVIRAILSQPWGNASVLRAELRQRWESTFTLRATLE